MDISGAIYILEQQGRSVVEQDIPGLYRIDGGPEVTTNQVIALLDDDPSIMRVPAASLAVGKPINFDPTTVRYIEFVKPNLPVKLT